MHVFLWIAGIAVTLVMAGCLYQSIGAQRDRRRYAGSGRWVQIDDERRLYLLEKGEGCPTVLFEAGIAATNLNWSHVQEAVASFTSTASYDRSGLGWSSPARTARTPGNIAPELHSLLQRGGIKPPYILVGHSFGGLVMRRFAICYPEEVAGVVLVDPMRCEEWPPLDPSKQSQLDLGRKLMRFAIPAARCGFVRLAVTSLLGRSCRLSGMLAGAAGNGGKHALGRITCEVGKMPRHTWPIIAAHWSRPSYYAGMFSHVDAIPETVREMHSAEQIRGVPVLVLTPVSSKPLSDEELLRIGDNTQQIIAESSEHWIHLDEPDLVVRSIREMVMAAAPESLAVGI